MAEKSEWTNHETVCFDRQTRHLTAKCQLMHALTPWSVFHDLISLKVRKIPCTIFSWKLACQKKSDSIHFYGRICSCDWIYMLAARAKEVGLFTRVEANTASLHFGQFSALHDLLQDALRLARREVLHVVVMSSYIDQPNNTVNNAFAWDLRRQIRKKRSRSGSCSILW